MTGMRLTLVWESTHDLHVQRFERVTSWLHEVDTCVDTVVDDVHAIHLVLGIQISIKPLLNILNDRSPRVIIVHEVTKARSVNDGQAETNAILLDVSTDGLYADGLWCKVERRLLALLWPDIARC